MTAKRILPLLLTLFALSIFTMADVVTTQNEFIKISVNTGPLELGRFSIDTTGGDPFRQTSRDQQLIYGGMNPWTSYVTINIDGKNYIFGGETRRRAGKNGNYGTHISGPTYKDNMIVTAYNYGDINVIQRLSIARGTSSRMLDTALISFEIENISSNVHEVGIRLTLDTKLGKNDGAPIRVGSHSVTYPRVFAGEDVPMSWQAFDSLANPTVISQSNLYGQGSEATRPNRVIFADWGTMADNFWGITINEKQGFWRTEDGDISPEDRELDTAAAIIWDRVTLDAYQSRVYNTNYGIGYINISPGNLALGITSPSEIKYLLERTEPFSVTGYLVNTGNFVANNVVLKLHVPKGLKIVGDTPDTLSANRVQPGDEMQGYWRLIPTGEVGGKLPIKLSVTSDNIEYNETIWEIDVDVPIPELHVTPSNLVNIPIETNGSETIIPVNVILGPSFDLQSCTFELHYNPDVIRPLPIARGSAMVHNGRLLPDWKASIDRNNGIITINLNRGDNVPGITQAEAVLAAITFYVVDSGDSELELVNASYKTTAGNIVLLPVTNGIVSTIKE